MANVVVVNAVGPEPVTLNCPSCKSQITTRTEKTSSSKTHLIAVLLCIVCFPCVCVPYCVDSCKNTDHYCPNCQAYIGQYRK